MDLVPNTDKLDFDKVHFSFREEFGNRFYRAFVEQSFFDPLGVDLNFRFQHSVAINVRGDFLPSAGELNDVITSKLDVLPEYFEKALMLYVECIGEDEFRERVEDGESVSVKSDDVVSGRNLSRDELMNMWKRGELHRLADLEQVSYEPSLKRLGFLFRLDWEPYFSDHGFALLIEKGEVDYGLDQNFF